MEQRYPDAEAVLQDAIDLGHTLAPEPAAAYCIQAQVLAAQNKNQPALTAAGMCVGYASGSIDEENEWIDKARSIRQRLMPKSSQP